MKICIINFILNIKNIILSYKCTFIVNIILLRYLSLTYHEVTCKYNKMKYFWWRNIVILPGHFYTDLFVKYSINQLIRCSAILFLFQMKAGFVINIISVLILCLALNSFIYPVFDLGNIPENFFRNHTSGVTQVITVVNSTLGYNKTNAGSWE